MLPIKMSRGQITLSILATIATTSTIISALGWNLVRTVTLGEQQAAVAEWQKHIDANQDSTDSQLAKMNEEVVSLKVTTATTNEIVKLIGERYQINSAAVEARVIRSVGTSTSLQTNIQNENTVAKVQR